MIEEGEQDDFQVRIRRSFERQGAMHTLGAELTRISQGVVEIELPFDIKLTPEDVAWLESGATGRKRAAG